MVVGLWSLTQELCWQSVFTTPGGGAYCQRPWCDEATGDFEISPQVLIIPIA